jgi:hypothetical protein
MGALRPENVTGRINPSGSHPRGAEIELSQADISFHISVTGVYQDAGPLNWQQGPILVGAVVVDRIKSECTFDNA